MSHIWNHFSSDGERFVSTMQQFSKIKIFSRLVCTLLPTKLAHHFFEQSFFWKILFIWIARLFRDSSVPKLFIFSYTGQVSTNLGTNYPCMSKGNSRKRSCPFPRKENSKIYKIWNFHLQNQRANFTLWHKASSCEGDL